MTIDEARVQLRRLAASIARIDARLAAVHRTLPASPERDAMDECRIPYDVQDELSSVADCVREEYLAPAAVALERAARIGRRDLVRRFRALRAMVEPESPRLGPRPVRPLTEARRRKP